MSLAIRRCSSSVGNVFEANSRTSGSPDRRLYSALSFAFSESRKVIPFFDASSFSSSLALLWLIHGSSPWDHTSQWLDSVSSRFLSADSPANSDTEARCVRALYDGTEC
jgi:hypothetical protein